MPSKMHGAMLAAMSQAEGRALTVGQESPNPSGDIAAAAILGVRAATSSVNGNGSGSGGAYHVWRLPIAA